MIRTRPGTWGCAAAAMALAACSALQIDVDVYQGSLSHERRIQEQQFAAMAIAAKPVLATLRNDLQRGSGTRAAVSQGPSDGVPAQCAAVRQRSSQRLSLTALRSASTPTKDDGWSRPRNTDAAIPVGELNKYSHTVQFESGSSSSRAAAFYLNGLLSFYEPSVCVHPDDDWDRARSALGLIDLFQLLVESDQVSEDDRSKAMAQLTASLVPFAERILFVVNNPGLFSDGKYQTERAILQTLGNSLLLHANDLRRRDKHAKQQEAQFDAQRRAAENATAPTAPGAVLQSIARNADVSRKKAEADEKAASDGQAEAASRETAAKKQEEQADAAVKSAEATLKKWRTPNPNIERVHVTLVDPDRAKDVAAALQDQASVVEIAAKLKPGETVSARELANEIVAWAARERDAARKGGERQLRLAAVANALDAKEPTLPVQRVGANRASLVLEGLQQLAKTEYDKSVAEQKALQARLDTAKLELGRARTQKAKAEADVRSAAETVKTAKAERAAAAVTAQMVTETLPRAIGAIGSSDQMHPEAVRQVVLSQLQPPTGSNAAAASLAAAREAVKTMTLVSGFDFSVGRYGDDTDKPRKTSIQVLDDLIAHLQTMRIRALAEGRPGEAKQLAEAAEVAEQQRTDQVFLRPSADYLRNVYSSTSLQDDNQDPTRNMLADYLRALRPRFGKTDEPGGGDAHKARRELEKLFWQNINRVTTSGGTRTNYVVAKDDVGNWYIKAYSVDPKDVFESAKGLALFNKGAKLDTNLLRRAELRDTARTGSATDRQEAKAELKEIDARSPAALEFGGRAQKRFETRYAEETQEAASALKARVADLPTKTLPASWTVHLKPDSDAKHKELLTQLQAAATTRQNGTLSESVSAMEGMVARIGDGQTHPSRLGLSIVDVLHATTRYRDDLALVLAANDHLKDAAQGDLLKALQGATKKAIDSLVDDVAQKRRRSVESYQEGLASIADVAK